MAEVNTNDVIEAEVKSEETGMTTTQPVTLEETKTDIVGKVKTGAKVVGAAALVAIAFCAGLAKGKAKSAAKASSNEDIVNAEEPTSEDEVSE